MDKQEFFTGKVFDAWRWFGAHIDDRSVIFRFFAPNAVKITVTGAFFFSFFLIFFLALIE